MQFSKQSSRTNDDELFCSLVTNLMSFDDLDPEIIALNFAILRHNKSAVGDIEALLDVYAKSVESLTQNEQAMRWRELRRDNKFAGTINQTLYLFYLGAIQVDGHWKRCGWQQHLQALVWRELSTHPPMSRGVSEFGDWSRPPHKKS